MNKSGSAMPVLARINAHACRGKRRDQSRLQIQGLSPLRPHGVSGEPVGGLRENRRDLSLLKTKLASPCLAEHAA